LVDDERTVEEIRLVTHSSEFHVSRVIYRQWQEGRMKVVKARTPRSVTGAIAALGGSTGAFNAPLPGGPPTATALGDAAKKFLTQESYEQALRHLRAARCLEPENQSVGDLLSSTEKNIRESVESNGVRLTSIPTLAVTFEQLTSSKISPQEGFMLTRIN